MANKMKMWKAYVCFVHFIHIHAAIARWMRKSHFRLSHMLVVSFTLHTISCVYLHHKFFFFCFESNKHNFTLIVAPTIIDWLRLKILFYYFLRLTNIVRYMWREEKSNVRRINKWWCDIFDDDVEFYTKN